MENNSLRYDERDVIRSLSLMTKNMRVAFAAACATRLLPAYFRFSQLTGRGDPEWIRMTAQRVWGDLEGDEMSVDELQAASQKCESLVPGEDQEPWTPVQAWADDAVAALAYVLRCRISGSEQDAAWAARRSYEAIDTYVVNSIGVETHSSHSEERVMLDPLIQAELGRQQRDLADLAVAENSVSVIAEIRKRAIDEAKEFFGNSQDQRGQIDQRGQSH